MSDNKTACPWPQRKAFSKKEARRLVGEVNQAFEYNQAVGKRCPAGHWHVWGKPGKSARAEKQRLRNNKRRGNRR